MVDEFNLQSFKSSLTSLSFGDGPHWRLPLVLRFSSVFFRFYRKYSFRFRLHGQMFFFIFSGIFLFFPTGNSFLPHQPTRSTLPWTDGAFHCFLHSPKFVKRNKNVIWYNTVLRQLIISFKKSNTRRGIRNYISLRIGLIEWT